MTTWSECLCDRAAATTAAATTAAATVHHSCHHDSYSGVAELTDSFEDDKFSCCRRYGTMRHDSWNYTARAHTRTCTLIKLTCLRAYPPSFIAKSSPSSPFSIWADEKLSLRGRRTANCHGTRDVAGVTTNGSNIGSKESVISYLIRIAAPWPKIAAPPRRYRCNY